MINVKSLKNRGNTSEKLSRERLPKTQLQWMRTLLNFIQFSHLSPIIPDALSHKNYETFLSWGNCFYSNLIPLFRLLSCHPKCVCVSVWVCRCLCVSWTADTTEYSGTPPGPNTRLIALPVTPSFSSNLFVSSPCTCAHVISCWRLKCKRQLIYFSSYLIRLLLTLVLPALFGCNTDVIDIVSKHGESFPVPNEWVTPKIKEMEDENQVLLWWGTLAEQHRAAICLWSDLSGKMWLVSIINPHLSFPCTPTPHPAVLLLLFFFPGLDFLFYFLLKRKFGGVVFFMWAIQGHDPKGMNDWKTLVWKRH